MLYVGVGIGAGYIFPRVSGEFSPAKLNSLLNVVIVAIVGHRFGDNFIVELMFKHRSNGELSKNRNYVINEHEMRIGYVF